MLILKQCISFVWIDCIVRGLYHITSYRPRTAIVSQVMAHARAALRRSAVMTVTFTCLKVDFFSIFHDQLTEIISATSG
jgi:hypothetical protein